MKKKAQRDIRKDIWGLDDEKLCLTPEEVKSFSAYKDASDETIQELIKFVYDLSLILYKSHKE